MDEVASPGQFGAILPLTAKDGRRDDLLRILTNYAGTLDGEPGTLLFAVAVVLLNLLVDLLVLAIDPRVRLGSR